ncbi:MAG: hypothetical protein KGL37_12830 [Acidobacteriota bacterium]|nr:hypothetical protein [Acidobacteriota bacterium]
MKKLALLLLAASLVSPAPAQTPVTIDLLEQLLIYAHGKSDGKVAGELYGLILTERASSARLARWEAQFRGKRTREALIALADASTFLHPPAADIDGSAPPTLAAQKEMLSRTVDYVAKTIPKLPNFTATRETTHFDDATPQQLAGQSRSGTAFQLGPADSAYQALRFAGSASVVVTYRDGQEVDAEAGKGKHSEVIAFGFTTKGEFGPILSVILNDALRTGVTWGYWEREATGPEAVFRYSVPQDRSHYEVSMPFEGRMTHLFPAYHGEIAIDPAKGDILRLTAVAEMKPPYWRIEAGIQVEYAPVVIGGSSYLCPVHGVALFRAPKPGNYTEAQQAYAPQRTQVNDVAFTHYHLFRAEMRILTNDEAKP